MRTRAKGIMSLRRPHWAQQSVQAPHE